MAGNDLTTVQISGPTKEKLRELAAANLRTMAAHLEFMVERDYSMWQRLGAQVPDLPENGRAPQPPTNGGGQ